MTVVALVGVWRLLILSVSILGPRRTTAVPLRIAVRQQTVQNVPSCQHRIAHIEILNRVRCCDHGHHLYAWDC